MGMTDPEHFPRAPIVEALLDVRVELPPSVGSETLASFHSQIARDFPTREVRKTVTGQLELKAGADPVTRTLVADAGYLFRSRDGLRVVQARRDGFSFSRLKPYTTWDEVVGEAEKLWRSYAALTRPKRVVRLALRYINRIEIPRPVDSLEDYLLIGPAIPKGMLQAPSGFFLRLALSDPHSQSSAIVTETIDEVASTPKLLSIILDIDVSRPVNLAGSGTELSKSLAPLRSYKNLVFSSSITERCKELFR